MNRHPYTESIINDTASNKNENQSGNISHHLTSRSQAGRIKEIFL